MGNQPSSESIGEQRRLTKPRTNNNTPSPKIGSSSPKSTRTQLADLGGDDIMWTSDGARQSKQEVRQKLRMHLFAPDEEVELKSIAADNDDGDSLAEFAATINERLTLVSRGGSDLLDMDTRDTPSRANTIKASDGPFFGNPKTNGSKTNLAQDKASEKRAIDVESAIQILLELKKTASPEQLVALHRALLPTRGGPTSFDNPPAETNAQPAPTLHRRRSMAVPGLATRNPFDVLLPEDDRPRSRAQTPGDMDYATLSNKVGRLMITNGAPSPAPSIISRHLDSKKSLPDMHQDDYFASEGQGSPETIRPAPRRANSFAPPPGYVESDARSIRPTTAIKKYRNSMQKPKIQVNDGRPPSKHSAEEYINELASSPFGETPFSRSTPSPRPPENHLLDEGFEELSEKDKFREEALRILDGSILSTSEKIPVDQQSRAHVDVGRESPADGKPQRPSQVPHSDSGYSSGASLNAVSRQSSSKQNGNSQGEAKPPARDPRQHGGVLGQSADAADAKNLHPMKQQMLAVPSSDDAHKDASTETSSESASAEAKKELRRSLTRSKSWRLSFRGSSSQPSSATSSSQCVNGSQEADAEPAKPVRHDSAMEQSGAGKIASKPSKRKLQKRKSHGPPPAPSAQKNEHTKDLPSSLIAGFPNRIEESPGKDHVDQTLDSQTNQDENVGDMSARFPSPAPSSVPDTESTTPTKDGKNKRSNSKRSPSPLKNAFSFRRKSKQPRPTLAVFEEKEEETREEAKDEVKHDAKRTLLLDRDTLKEVDTRSKHDLRQEAKQEAKQAKQDAKQEAKQAKLDAKQAKLDAKQAKHEAKEERKEEKKKKGKETATEEPRASEDGEDAATNITDFGTITESLGGSPYDIATLALPVKPKMTDVPSAPHHFSTNFVKAPKHRTVVSMDAELATFLGRPNSNGRTIDPPDILKIGPKKRPVSYDHHGQQQKRLASSRNFSRPSSAMAESSQAEKAVAPAPPKHKYKPYRPAGLRSWSQGSVVTQRVNTYEALHEKIPVEVEEIKEEEEEETEEAKEDRRWKEEKIAVFSSEEQDERPSTPTQQTSQEGEQHDGNQNEGQADQQQQQQQQAGAPPKTPDAWAATSAHWRQRHRSIRQGLVASLAPSAHVIHTPDSSELSASPPKFRRAETAPAGAPTLTVGSTVMLAPKQQQPLLPHAAPNTHKKRSSIQRYYSTLNRPRSQTESQVQAQPQQQPPPRSVPEELQPQPKVQKHVQVQEPPKEEHREEHYDDNEDNEEQQEQQNEEDNQHEEYPYEELSQHEEQQPTEQNKHEEQQPEEDDEPLVQLQPTTEQAPLRPLQTLYSVYAQAQSGPSSTTSLTASPVGTASPSPTMGMNPLGHSSTSSIGRYVAYRPAGVSQQVSQPQQHQSYSTWANIVAGDGTGSNRNSIIEVREALQQQAQQLDIMEVEDLIDLS